MLYSFTFVTVIKMQSIHASDVLVYQSLFVFEPCWSCAVHPLVTVHLRSIVICHRSTSAMNTRGKTNPVAKATRSKVAAAAAARRHIIAPSPQKKAPVKKAAPAKKRAPKKKAAKNTKPLPASTVTFQTDVVTVSLTQANNSLVSGTRTMQQLLSSISQILQHDPTSFTVSFETNTSWLNATITLHRRVLDRFPLLVDMEVQTSPGSDSPHPVVQFQPPSTIWSFLAAVALLEDPDKCKIWLCSAELGLSLAGATLEVRLLRAYP